MTPGSLDSAALTPRDQFEPASQFALPRLSLRSNLLIFVLFSGVSLLLRLPGFFRSVLDWDESLYFLMAEQWRGGHLPYLTIWDNKPVGIYAIFALFQTIFGNGIGAIRIAAVVASARTSFMIYRIVLKIGSDEQRYAIGAAVFSGLMFAIAALSNGGQASNTELFMVIFTCGAAWCVFDRKLLAARPVLKSFCAGLLLGSAFMIKYVMVFEAITLTLALIFTTPAVSRGRRLAMLAAAIAGASLPMLLTGVLYLHAGAAPIWLDESILSNLRRSAAGFARIDLPFAEKLVKWISLNIAGAIVVWRALRDPRDATAMVLALWLITAALGVIAAKSFYSHYFIEMLPPLCVCFGWVLGHAVPGGIKRWSIPAQALAALLLAIPTLGAAGVAIANTLHPLISISAGGIRFHADTPDQIAADIAPLSAPSGFKLYVFDYQPVLYVLTGARLPTRFPYPADITTLFLARVARIEPEPELQQILAHDPEFIVVARAPISELPENPVIYRDLRQSIALRYDLWKQYDEAKVYRLKNNMQTAGTELMPLHAL